MVTFNCNTACSVTVIPHLPDKSYIGKSEGVKSDLIDGCQMKVQVMERAGLSVLEEAGSPASLTLGLQLLIPPMRDGKITWAVPK